MTTLLVVIGGVALSVRHWNKNQPNQTQDAQVEAAPQVVTELEAQQAKVKELTAQNKQLRKECTKGKKAYDLLTPFSKTKTQVPNCSLED